MFECEKDEHYALSNFLNKINFTIMQKINKKACAILIIIFMYSKTYFLAFFDCHTFLLLFAINCMYFFH